MNRMPTEKQYRTLLNLGGGSAGLSFRRRETNPMLRRGWVTAELKGDYYQWVRITPVGLHALAEAVERYGLPDLGPKPQTERRLCADCGSARWRTEMVGVAA